MLTVGTQKVNSQKMANVEPENDEKSSDGPTIYRPVLPYVRSVSHTVLLFRLSVRVSAFVGFCFLPYSVCWLFAPTDFAEMCVRICVSRICRDLSLSLVNMLLGIC